MRRYATRTKETRIVITYVWNDDLFIRFCRLGFQERAEIDIRIVVMEDLSVICETNEIVGVVWRTYLHLAVHDGKSV
jgi:hypothetical protein